MIGNTLFVADHHNNRVLRFTGPFTTPDQVYVATGSFTGLFHPIDLVAHPDGSLLVTDQGNTRIARYSNAAWSGSQAAPASVFSDYMNPEPLGIAVDQIGRIYIADYRAFRVLIRDEYIKRTPISSVNSLAARTLLADLHSRPGRTIDRVAIGPQWDHGSAAPRATGRMGDDVA